MTDNDYIQWIAERITENSRDIPDFSWHGDHDIGTSWAFVASISRDSTSNEKTRYSRMAVSLARLFPEDAIDARSTHWGHGWVRQILIRTLDESGCVTTAAKDVIRRLSRMHGFTIRELADYLESSYGPLSSPRIAPPKVYA